MGISVDELVRRNAEFVAGGAFAGLSFPSHQTLRVITCVDSRVDPADVLGLALGDAVVLRNIGGRITPSVLRELALLAELGRGGPRTAAHTVVMHHTQCGIRALAAYPDRLAEFFEIPADELAAKAVADPYAAVRIDAGILRAALPGETQVTGLVYDVDTGRIEVAAPPVTGGSDV
jgi:carbonic anhydrase